MHYTTHSARLIAEGTKSSYHSTHLSETFFEKTKYVPTREVDIWVSHQLNALYSCANCLIWKRSNNLVGEKETSTYSYQYVGRWYWVLHRISGFTILVFLGPRLSKSWKQIPGRGIKFRHPSNRDLNSMIKEFFSRKRYPSYSCLRPYWFFTGTKIGEAVALKFGI